MTRWILLLVACAACALPCEARGGRARGPQVVEEPDGSHVRLHIEGDDAAQAWLLKDAEPKEEGGKVDLLVALHGLGGNPRNFLSPGMARERNAWILAPAGHTTIQTDRGPGYTWEAGDVEYVAEFVKYLVGKYPIDADRVIVWGLSAGGTMTLEMLGYVPELFAGGVTTASPRTPESRHDTLRIGVFLGTTDPNWSGAPAVRSYVEGLEKKRKKGACVFFAVEGLPHEPPEDRYLSLAFDWVLREGARGGEATVPKSPAVHEGELQHILVRWRGSEGAPDDLRRSKGAAAKLIKDIAKNLERGKAWFPIEACCHSDDRDTGPLGGTISSEDLAAFGLDPPMLAPGETSGILESPHGYHLVHRREDSSP